MVATATAPASSANLGPGFDVLALALEARTRVEASRADAWDIRGTAVDDKTEALVTAAAMGGPFEIVISSRIPTAAGLGSSAALAAAVAVATARAEGAELASGALVELVSRIEGHPDNAAAAVHGGLVAVGPGGVRRLPVAPNLAFVVAVPAERLPTTEARQVLPERIPHAAAARGVRRVVFLLDALRTGERAAFTSALGDELHEPYRDAVSPVTADLHAAALGAGAWFAARSGAGPSLLAIVDHGGVEQVATALRPLVGSGEVLRLEVARDGVR